MNDKNVDSNMRFVDNRFNVNKANILSNSKRDSLLGKVPDQ